MQSAFKHLNTTKEESAYNFLPVFNAKVKQIPFSEMCFGGKDGKKTTKNGFTTLQTIKHTFIVAR